MRVCACVCVRAHATVPVGMHTCMHVCMQTCMYLYELTCHDSLDLYLQPRFIQRSGELVGFALVSFLCCGCKGVRLSCSS